MGQEGAHLRTRAGAWLAVGGAWLAVGGAGRGLCPRRGGDARDTRPAPQVFVSQARFLAPVKSAMSLGASQGNCVLRWLQGQR